MSTLEDTNELPRINTEESHPREHLDFALLLVAILVFVPIVLWLMPLIDTERWPVDSSRIVMAMASVASVIGAVAVGTYVVNSCAGKRHQEYLRGFAKLMREARNIRDDLEGLQPARIAWLAAQIEATNVNLRIIAAQLLDQDIQAELPAAEVDRLTKEAYDLGREVERRQHP